MRLFLILLILLLAGACAGPSFPESGNPTAFDGK